MATVQRAHTAFYRGVYYRSRLEACWAAFFEAHRIEVEYEQRYITFDDGTKYQPDFWLPDSRAWFEVKGRMSHADADKIKALSRWAVPRGEVVLLGGSPAGYTFGEVNERGCLNLNASFGRCYHCDVWAYAMGCCRQCGFADAEIDTYIDFHDSFRIGDMCISVCGYPSTWTWGGGPERVRFDDKIHGAWSSDALHSFSAYFEIISVGPR